MIAAAATGSKDEFESLLDATIDRLKITLATAPAMGNEDFENSVKRAMEQAAVGTSFKNKIVKTKRGEFPDITAATYYGVEVKQIQKDSTRTRGNSIFESTRVDGVEAVYLVMSWNNATPQAQVRWRRYEDAIAGIVITHSPRYLLDINLPEDKTMFDEIEVPYDEFRELEQNLMMEKVRGMYQGNEDANLWWLETGDHYREPMTHFESMGKPARYQLIGEAFFLCPVVFGPNQRRKYAAPMAYWLSQGYAAQVVRDKFTSSGKEKIMGVEVPQIITRAKRHKSNIEKAATELDDELIMQFWGTDKPPQDRIGEWLQQVQGYYTGSANEMQILRKIFGRG